jgi:HAMP domain-containing protein
MQKANLKTKAIIFVVMIVATSLAATTFTAHLRMNEFIRSEQINRAESVARSISHAGVLALAVGDNEELDRLVNLFLVEKNVLFIAIYDSKNKIVSYGHNDASTWKEFKNHLDNQNDYFLGEYPVKLAHNFDQLGIFNADSPDKKMSESNQKSFIGMVKVGLSANPVVDAQKNQQKINLFIFIIVVSISSLFAWFMVNAWVRRLDRLVSASWRISHGNLSYPIQESGEDEVGRLSQAFETMRKSLKRREHEYRRLNDTLKQQVKERTTQLEIERDKALAAMKSKDRLVEDFIRDIEPPIALLRRDITTLSYDVSEEEADAKLFRRMAQTSENLEKLAIHLKDTVIRSTMGINENETHFSLRDALEEILQAIDKSLIYENAVIFCHYQSEYLAEQIGEEGKIRQVLSSICNNIYAFVEINALKVTIKSSRQDKNHMRFQVIFTFYYADELREEQGTAQEEHNEEPALFNLEIAEEVCQSLKASLSVGHPQEGEMEVEFSIDLQVDVSMMPEESTARNLALFNKRVMVYSRNSHMANFITPLLEEGQLQPVITSRKDDWKEVMESFRQQSITPDILVIHAGSEEVAELLSCLSPNDASALPPVLWLQPLPEQIYMGPKVRVLQQPYSNEALKDALYQCVSRK